MDADGEEGTMSEAPAGRRGLVVVLGVLAALAVAAWLFLTPATDPAPSLVPSAPEAAAPAAPTVSTEPATAAAAPVQETAGTPASATERLQARLDAIAKAYNSADARAMEQALWSNHAVVRPDGKTYYRSDLMAQWAREWAEYRRPSLSFAIEEISQSGEQITAQWGVILTAEVLDAQEEAHELVFSGSQKASYRIVSGQEVLDGPMVYTWSETTMDGYPWRPEQSGS
jgi:hypothetical protein